MLAFLTDRLSGQEAHLARAESIAQDNEASVIERIKNYGSELFADWSEIPNEVTILLPER